MGADVRAPTRLCPPTLIPMQARGAGVVTGLIPLLVSLAVLSSAPAGVGVPELARAFERRRETTANESD